MSLPNSASRTRTIFSQRPIWRLLGALRHLGMDVEIVVRQHGSGKVMVREIV